MVVHIVSQAVITTPITSQLSCTATELLKPLVSRATSVPIAIKKIG